MKKSVNSFILTVALTVLFSVSSLVASGLQLISPTNNAVGTPQNQLLKWGMADKASHYRVLVAVDANLTEVVKDQIVDRNEMSFYSTELGVRYFWKVEAMSDEEVMLSSDTWTFQVYTDELPSAPVITYPNYDNAVFTGETFRVSWLASQDVSEYSLALIANANITPPDTYWLNGIENMKNGFEQECHGTFIFFDTFIYDPDKYKKPKDEKKKKFAELGEEFYFAVMGQNENGFGQESETRHFRKTNHLEVTANAERYQVFDAADIDGDNQIELIYQADGVTYMTKVGSFDNLGAGLNGLIEPDGIWIDTFWIQSGTALPISTPRAACYGRFNHDDNVDLALFGDNSKLMLRTETGFSTSEIDVPAEIEKVIAYDMDRDGLDDIIFKNRTLIGAYKPGINIRPPDTYWVANDRIHDILLNDMNNDYHKDLIVIEDLGGRYESRILINNYPEFEEMEVVKGKILDAAVSVNGTPVYTINEAGVLYKRTNERDYILGYGNYDKVYEKDLDGDGLEEVIAYAAEANTIVTFTYEDGEYVELFQNKTWEISDIFMADFTGDGRPDMLTSSKEGTVFYKNFEETVAQMPAIPETPRFSYSGNEILLEWDLNIRPPDTFWITPPDTYWLPVSKNYKYQIELVDEDYMPILTAYNELVCSDNEFSTTTTNDFFVLPELEEGIYNWRVRTVRPSGAVSEFTEWQPLYTMTIAPLPPATWLHEKKTGSNATIIVENSPAMYEGKELEAGDAVGVFYQSGEELVCGGYAIKRGDGNFAMTAWGDNKITETTKDGFVTNEELKFKLWDADEQKEVPAYGSFDNSPVVYSKDEKYYVNEFDKLEETEIILPANKAVYVASSIKPYNPFIGTIIDENVSYDDLIGEECEFWNDKSGYILYSAEDKVLTIAGQSMNLNEFSVPVVKGENLVPYVLNYSADIESVFENVKSDIIAVKDDEGRFYIPSMKINEIKVLNPNSAYMVYAKNDFDMSFDGSNIEGCSNTQNTDFKHYSSTDLRTGHSMGLVIDCADLDAGDEVIIKDISGRKIGSAVSQKGRAVVSVWGDNPFTNEIEGAVAGDELVVEVYHKSLAQEIKPTIKNSYSLISNDAHSLTFTDNELLIVKAELNTIMSSVFDGTENNMINIYPNPASEYITIEINNNNIESMAIYSLSGQKITEVQKSNISSTIRFNVEGFNSGVYFLRTTIGNKVYENRIIVQ
jgi:hypothetical protein